MRRIARFEELSPGDILIAMLDIPRWIGTLYHFAGFFCQAGEQMVVTDVYPNACRVIHSEGGIHYFTSKRCFKQFQFADKGKPLSWQRCRYASPNIEKGSWPRYNGSYRLGILTTPSFRLPINFAIVAKRQPGKTGTTKTKTKHKK